ncbi:MAG: thiamine pyrophosphate-binding protein [Methanobacteriaceae archaeon]|nr:thiamine pyrophosphate-binding protein [Methanobacteriaceae archaeon]
MNGIKCVDKLVEILTEHDTEYVFGYPGDQILPLYNALRTSSIKHILVRHEQSAAHAADSYSRVKQKPGICIATAGPGALNLVMGVATAYKDNVPLIVITGDVPTNIKGQDTFQDVDLNNIFKSITNKSFYVKTPEEAIQSLLLAYNLFEDGIIGPVHINLPKNVQEELLHVDVTIEKTSNIEEINNNDIKSILKSINQSKKPLLIVGSGIIWADAIKELDEFLTKTKIPLTTTYPARGVIPENTKKNLGLIGNRGNSKTKFAAQNADLILAFATRLSERTIKDINTKNIIQINTKKQKTKHKYYQTNIKKVLKKLNENKIKTTSLKWIQEIEKQEIKPDTTVITRKENKLIPSQTIKTILNTIKNHKNDITITNDAGTHTTWTTILNTITQPYELVFSGGFGPMGYAIPASIGASFAKLQNNIVAITGDGAFQMTQQELATINEYQLPIIIIIINNNKLGIIKQWQEMIYNHEYQIELENPDFIKLAEAYNIKSKTVKTYKELIKTLEEALNLKKPYLIEVPVIDQKIPLPK